MKNQKKSKKLIPMKGKYNPNKIKVKYTIIQFENMDK